MNKKVTNLTIKKMKQEGTPISMITAYDYIMAQNVDEAGIDMDGRRFPGQCRHGPYIDAAGHHGRYDPSHGGCRPWCQTGPGRR